jgi:hypothetical protein
MGTKAMSTRRVPIMKFWKLRKLKIDNYVEGKPGAMDHGKYLA